MRLGESVRAWAILLNMNMNNSLFVTSMFQIFETIGLTPCGHEDGHSGVADGEDDGDVLLDWLLQAGSVGPLPLDTKLCHT